MSKLFNNTTSLNEILEDLKTKATPSGGTNTSDATAVAADILAGKTAYVKDGKVTGIIETKTSSNLTASGATVTVPAGYYASNASKSITTGKAITPTTTITAKPSITIDSAGKITASASTSKSITPTITAGYVSSGTAGTVTVSGSNTKQLTTKAATTYTPGTSNQTIAASTYLTGIQTIQGDTNLVAENIKSGTSIFGVTGTYTGSGGGEDVTSEVSEYTTKIASLENAVASLEAELANKASGGTGSGSLETCSLTLDFSAKINSAAIGCDIIDENGDAIGATIYMNSTLNLVTIENVVCASSLFILYDGYDFPGFSCENCYKLPLTPLIGSAIAHPLHTFKITAPKGGNAKITVYNND